MSYTDDEIEYLQERAAILEFYGGMPRKEAEREAVNELKRKRKYNEEQRKRSHQGGD